jgi:acyl-CoA dehydrogenase
MHTICLIALPVVYAAYLGTAEAARELALRLAARRKDDPVLPLAVGELERAIVTARLIHADMVALAASAKPGPEATAAMLTRRGILGDAVVLAVEKAMEAAGGAGFYRDAGLERLFRDVQASRYHPLPDKVQARVTGRVLLGLDIDG